VPESRWRILYNGLDLERFKPDAGLRSAFRSEHGLDDSVVAIGVACALRPRKQLEHLFKAAARVSSSTLRVVVAGGPVAGDEFYASELIDMGRQLLGDRFVHLGHMRDLRAFYNGLDVFVNTSQEEACSISVIESLASGLPVVGYPSTSVDEQVLPSGGEIVAQDDIRALAGALEQWISDPGHLVAARSSARARAVDVFDIRKLATQLWHEYAVTAGEGR
jgi:glycosyltransferase involved in cell wall biosynthesis